MGNRLFSGLRTDLSNPGNPEDVTKSCKECFPTTFEGAKFSVNKGLSQHFNISHTLTLSNLQSSSYRFGATFVGSNVISPSEAYPIILGDIDPSGNLNANVIHRFLGCRLRCVAQYQDGQLGMSQVSLDREGPDWSISLTAANPDILNFSGIYVAQYLQSVTNRIALGTDLIYQRGPAVPGGQVAILKAVARYRVPEDWSLTGCVGGGSASLSYFQMCSENLKVGIECEGNQRLQEVVTTVGYAVDIPRLNLTYRAAFDSNWTVSSVFEKKLMPLPLTLVLSGQLNQSKNNFRLGCGILLG